MRSMLKTPGVRSALFLAFAVFAGFGNAAAQGGPAGLIPTNNIGSCINVVSINRIGGGGVLYKPENIHGGRGPSFLVQNVAERTNKPVIEVRDARCQPVATLGLFRTDQPYGSRYYSRSGGTGQSAEQLLALAKNVGSSNLLIEGVGKWILIKNPRNREGSVRK